VTLSGKDHVQETLCGRRRRMKLLLHVHSGFDDSSTYPVPRTARDEAENRKKTS